MAKEYAKNKGYSFMQVKTVLKKLGETKMNYRLNKVNNDIVVVESSDILISNSNEAMDLYFSVNYETECTKLILKKENIIEEFFDLKTKIAGEILQKFINYDCKLAIVGDFEIYASKALRDFIFECNKGVDFFFVKTVEEAVEKFKNVNSSVAKSK